MNESTAHIVPSECDPEHGTRYTIKHADGREVWADAESYSPELLWADWSAGNVEYTPF